MPRKERVELRLWVELLDLGSECRVKIEVLMRMMMMIVKVEKGLGYEGEGKKVPK